METLKTDTHEFIISIDNKSKNDMKQVINEYSRMGFEKVAELDYKDNLILIYAKNLEES